MSLENIDIKLEQNTDFKCDLLKNIDLKLELKQENDEQHFEETIDEEKEILPTLRPFDETLKILPENYVNNATEGVEESGLENSIYKGFTVKKEYDSVSDGNKSPEYSFLDYDEKIIDGQSKLENSDTSSPLQANQCPKCRYIFKTEAYFKRHKCKHSKTVCNICQKTFTELNMKAHKKIHDNIRTYLCIECDKSFLRCNDLTKHLKTHTGDKRFACHFCERKFAEKGHLRDHIRSHTGEKPYHCKICDYKSSLSSSLKRHIRCHTGEKLYSCNLCDGKRFSNNNCLQIHIRGHTGEKPYECDMCQYKCTNLSGLRSHKKIHSDEKSLKCEFCEYRSRFRSDIKRHTLKIHPLEAEGMMVSKNK